MLQVLLSLKKKKKPSTIWSVCVKCLSVATAPCTTLHWRATLHFSMEGLYMDLQLSLGEEPATLQKLKI